MNTNDRIEEEIVRYLEVHLSATYRDIFDHVNAKFNKKPLKGRKKDAFNKRIKRRFKVLISLGFVFDEHWAKPTLSDKTTQWYIPETFPY